MGSGRLVITHHIEKLKNSLCEQYECYQLLETGLYAGGFAIIVLFNPPTNSGRFFLFYFTDEESRLGKVK